MLKKVLLPIFFAVILTATGRSDFYLNRDQIINDARIGIDLSGNYSIVNSNLTAASSQIGNNSANLLPVYQQIYKITEQIKLLKLQLNPALSLAN